MKHEVIVYRNPAEAALWDFITSTTGSNLVLWLVCAAIVGVAFLHIEGAKLRRLPEWLLKPWVFVVVALIDTHILYLAAKWALTYL